jgi:hypothetical protein
VTPRSCPNRFALTEVGPRLRRLKKPRANRIEWEHLLFTRASEVSLQLPSRGTRMCTAHRLRAFIEQIMTMR